MQLFKGLAQEVQSAVNFQVLALVLVFAFFVFMAWVVIRRPKDYYKKVSELPLNDQLTADDIIDQS